MSSLRQNLACLINYRRKRKTPLTSEELHVEITSSVGHRCRLESVARCQRDQSFAARHSCTGHGKIFWIHCYFQPIGVQTGMDQMLEINLGSYKYTSTAIMSQSRQPV